MRFNLPVSATLALSRAQRLLKTRPLRAALSALLTLLLFVVACAHPLRWSRGHNSTLAEQVQALASGTPDADEVLCAGRATFENPESVIWTFWDDERALPSLVAEMVHAWKIWNPESEVVLLTNSNVHCFLPDDTFEMFRKLTALRSDLIRLSVLKLYGGTWMDATILLTEPLPTGPLPEFQGIYTEHFSYKPRDFPESWHIRAAKGSRFISHWLVLLQTVTYTNGPSIAGLSSTHIYTPESTNSYYKLERAIGNSAVYWSEYLVVYVAYTYAYHTNEEFRNVILRGDSYASEKVGYLLPWHLDWNMTEMNIVLSRPVGDDPLHRRLQGTKMIKLSTSNTAVGVDLAAHQYNSFVGHCLRKVHNSAGVERSKFRLVITRYNEDVSWSAPYRGARVLYDKGGKPEPAASSRNAELKEWEHDEVHHIENTGTECSGYLRYIIANYDSLPEFVGFSQGSLDEDHAWIRRGWGPRMFLTMLDEARDNGGCSKPSEADAETSADFGLHFNPMKPRDAHYQVQGPSSPFPDLAAWMAYHRWSPVDGKIYLYPSSYMVVSRERIRSTSKSAYRQLLALVSHHRVPPEGHYMERSWWYIFNCSP